MAEYPSQHGGHPSPGGYEHVCADKPEISPACGRNHESAGNRVFLSNRRTSLKGISRSTAQNSYKNSRKPLTMPRDYPGHDLWCGNVQANDATTTIDNDLRAGTVHTPTFPRVSRRTVSRSWAKVEKENQWQSKILPRHWRGQTAPISFEFQACCHRRRHPEKDWRKGTAGTSFILSNRPSPVRLMRVRHLIPSHFHQRILP